MKRSILLIIAIFLSSPAFAVDLDEIQIHGFASQGFLKSTENDYFYAKTKDGTFEYNEFGLTISAQTGPGLRVGMQLLARDFGIFGNDKVLIDWALAEYHPYDIFGFQVGKLKLPMGLYNQSRDVDATRTHALLPASFYNEVTRESLLSLKGFNLLGYMEQVGIEYQLMYGVGNFPVDGDYAQYLLVSQGIPLLDTQLEAAFITNMKWNTPLDGLTIGGNYLYMPDFSFYVPPINPMLPPGEYEYENEWIEIVGFAEYQRNALTLTFEHAFDTVTSELVGVLPEDETTSQSFYARLACQVNDKVQVGGYYSVIYRDTDDKDGDGFVAEGKPAAAAWNKQFTISTRFDIIDNLILKLEVHRFDGLYYVDYDPLDPEDVGILFAGKVTTFF